MGNLCWKKIKNSWIIIKSFWAKKKEKKVVKGIGIFLKGLINLLMILAILAFATIPLVLSPIITNLYLENIRNIENDEIADLSLKVGEFYYRKYRMDDSHELKIEIDKLATNATLIVHLLDHRKVSFSPNGTFEIDRAESSWYIYSKSYAKGVFYPRYDTFWYILVHNNNFFNKNATADFSLTITVMNSKEKQLVSIFSYIEALQTISLTPIISVATVIGFLWGAGKFIDKVFFDEGEKTKDDDKESDHLEELVELQKKTIDQLQKIIEANQVKENQNNC